MEHFVDCSDGQVLVHHLLIIKFESDNPWIDSIIGTFLKNWDFIVQVDKLLVSLYDGFLWIWIIEDL